MGERIPESELPDDWVPINRVQKMADVSRQDGDVSIRIAFPPDDDIARILSEAVSSTDDATRLRCFDRLYRLGQALGPAVTKVIAAQVKNSRDLRSQFIDFLRGKMVDDRDWWGGLLD